jgi:hypothetical protein
VGKDKGRGTEGTEEDGEKGRKRTNEVKVFPVYLPPYVFKVEVAAPPQVLGPAAMPTLIIADLASVKGNHKLEKRRRM